MVTEFAIVKVRSSRIEQLIAEKKKGAIAAQKVTTHLDEYLSACQLGITITALGLGALGKPTIEKLLYPFIIESWNIADSVASIISFTLAFSIITYLHVVVGELAPKTLAIQKAEKVTLIVAPLIMFFYRLMFPFIWLLNGSSRLLVSLFGLKLVSEHEGAHSEEELRILMSESYKSGEINQTELKYVNKIFEFDEKMAKEVMVPRTEMMIVADNTSTNDFLKMAAIEKYTRYPVAVDGDKDNIIGVVNAKEIMGAVVFNNELRKLPVTEFLYSVLHIIEKCPINDLLRKMQKTQTHITILIDEYGGTAGLITVEDILEEIVGEIRDEFDSDEVLDIQKISDGHYILSAKVSLIEVNALLNISILKEDIDTIGGWILSQKMDIQVNDTLTFDQYTFKVNELDGHQIKEIEVKIQPKVTEYVSTILE